MSRRLYPSDVSDEEWSFVAPYLILMDQSAPQRQHDLREVFNALRWLVRAGAPWRMLPNDLPPWEAVYQQSRRWLDAGCFEAMVSDLRSIIRVAQGKQGQPSAVVFDGRTLQSQAARVDLGLAMTATSVAMAPKFTWPWTRWATCWLCMSRLPMSKNAIKSMRCAKRCSK